MLNIVCTHTHPSYQSIPYSDTDSIFILFPTWITTKPDAFKWLKTICDAVTNHFASMEAGSPIMLQAEKCMSGGILTNKKRYIFMKYEGVNDTGKILAKGVEIARRDNCEMVVDCMTLMVKKLFTDADKDGAVQILKDTLRDLMGGKVDIGRLVISKAISKEDYKTDPPHVAVAHRMKLRDPSYEAGTAERIPYVIAANGGKSVAERAEDPLWLINHHIGIDLDYYIQNQLAGPVSRILMWIYGCAQDKHTISKYEDELRRLEEAGAYTKKTEDGLKKAIKLMQDHTISHFFGPAALSAFPRKIQSTAAKKGAIDSFFRRATPAVKRCVHGEPVDSCPVCNPMVPASVCILCARKTIHMGEGNICIACAQHRCFHCLAPLAATAQTSTSCPVCLVIESLRKRYRLSDSPSKNSDIEDLLKKAAEAKLQCDKCRGYADETEISCFQKDCCNLYKRATLDIMIKNICQQS